MRAKDSLFVATVATRLQVRRFDSIKVCDVAFRITNPLRHAVETGAVDTFRGVVGFSLPPHVIPRFVMFSSLNPSELHGFGEGNILIGREVI
jgi:hypothetical protein